MIIMSSIGIFYSFSNLLISKSLEIVSNAFFKSIKTKNVLSLSLTGTLLSLFRASLSLAFSSIMSSLAI